MLSVLTDEPFGPNACNGENRGHYGAHAVVGLAERKCRWPIFHLACPALVRLCVSR